MNTPLALEFPGQVQALLADGETLVFIKCGNPDLLPLLMAHGWLESKAVWRRVLPHLADRHYCAALDFLGHGDSDKPPDGDCSIPAQAVPNCGDYPMLENWHYSLPDFLSFLAEEPL